MTENKTQPTAVPVDEFLAGVSDKRRAEARTLIEIMQRISGHPAVMWGPSIIGFGKTHYKYESGREGEMGLLGFSPRKANLTVYFSDGFHRYGDLLDKLGKHKTSVSCLYINKLEDVDVKVLEQMIQRSYEHQSKPAKTTADWATMDEYMASLRGAAAEKLQRIRQITRESIPHGEEVIAYQIPTVKVGGKNIVHFAGYRDHVSIYPIPKGMEKELAAYQRGKGTLWFPIDKPLPEELIRKIVKELIVQRGK
ncbi:MAG TPA: DUF1801 domain-containing protein [Bellilinea sp.]|nr:DUF1801 domain-containing protein [Bellilinea sp.]